LSDQDNTNNAQSDETSATVVAPVDRPASQGAATAVNSSAAPRKSSSLVAWLALLLVIALTLGVAWVVREGQAKELALTQRMAQLETVAQGKQASQKALENELRTGLASGLATLETKEGGELSRLSKSLESLKALARFSGAERENWLLAETGHLLRLANQRLVMGADPVAAEALLKSADTVLRGVDDPSLHVVRAAIAKEIAALRALPKVDLEGIYLRIAALIEQADKLVIFQLPKQAERPQPAPASDWQGRLHQGYKAALSKLSDYVIIRRRDVPMQALMDPQWEGLVRQNLRMLLEQAQIALLSDNQAVYVASLKSAQQGVAQFQASDEVGAKAISGEIARLQGLTIGIAEPDISRSLQALDDAIEKRLQSEGGQ
jgi:uroporphyrin-III C-methyltransferase